MLTVRPRKPRDDAALALLFEEMQEHYRVPCPLRETILDDLANLPPGVEILVAETDRLIGLATFSAIYPGPGLKGDLFLKDLFVTRPARGSGVGRRLLQAMAKLAIARGLKRIDWTADRDNARLLAWYDGTGAGRQEEKVFFRLKGEAMEKFADGS